MRDTWQLQEAKNKLSEVVRGAHARPQIITLRGKEEAVVLSYSEYQRMTGKGSAKTLLDVLDGLPSGFADIDLARSTDMGRNVEL
ncbi:Antitoxin [Candidatus Nitrotoga sp. BS]|uniref:type II toxin-antitoxin system Phd/YefM family antitoxin n=1 Tax=Candidatus Nitrotoga sp. BS TaxID=2890408 RepID=UPI001EF3AE93|nr:type II toxin-antitoxin system Phd/YefM family antitoxin [Candidatus Nitrotoga sp. BS]CAH1209294.1 Antitoxin [Candidatus Nitrotoga sp. BS]